MNLDLIILALALAVDSSVFAFAYGLVLKQERVKCLCQLALTVTLFHVAMMLVGYLGGGQIKELVQRWEHWIVCGTFCVLGGSVIYQAIKGAEPCAEGKCLHKLPLSELLLIGVATSVDVLAVGACAAIGDVAGLEYGQEHAIAVASLTIGGVAGIACMLSFLSTHYLKRLPTRYLELLAGLLLIYLGLHNLLEH